MNIFLFGTVGYQRAEADEPIGGVASPVTTRDEPHASTDLQQILQYVGDADTKSLLDLYQSTHDPVIHAITAMAVERTRFNLEAASKDAQICEDSLFTTKPEIALWCGRFQAGNLRLGGHWQAAKDKIAQLVQRYAGHGLDSHLAGLRKYQTREASMPSFALEPPTADVTLTLQHGPRPVVIAKANGRDFDLLVDTGATNMIVGQDSVRDLGIKLLDQTDHLSGLLSKDVPTQKGLLDVLQIGAITMRNVPVTIVPHMPQKIPFDRRESHSPFGHVAYNVLNTDDLWFTVGTTRL